MRSANCSDTLRSNSNTGASSARRKKAPRMPLESTLFDGKEGSDGIPARVTNSHHDGRSRSVIERHLHVAANRCFISDRVDPPLAKPLALSGRLFRVAPRTRLQGSLIAFP